MTVAGWGRTHLSAARVGIPGCSSGRILLWNLDALADVEGVLGCL